MLMESGSVGSERLRRALERNRAKRARQGDNRNERMLSRLGKRPPPGRQRPLPGGMRSAASVASPPLSRPEPIVESVAVEASAAPAQVRSPKMSRFLSGLWEYLLRLTWLFCGVLILRLIFTHGGVVDFYKKRDRLKLKQGEFLAIKAENQEIVEEIDKIKNSPEYQKQLVRSHMEFIAPDEFLILFAKEGVQKKALSRVPMTIFLDRGVPDFTSRT